MQMELKLHVISTVSAEQYYRKRFPSWNPLNRPNQICPWHDDHKASLSVGLNNGGARCHACPARIGNIVHFEAKQLDISETEAASLIYAEFIRPIVPDRVFASMQKALERNSKVQRMLANECGITESGIETFALGWDQATNRLAIPVFDKFDQLVNLRLYRPPSFRSKSDEAYKVLNLVLNRKQPNEIKFGANDLFSWPHFQTFELDKPVFVMPSEKEMIIGMQEGLQCVCATAGENSWNEAWNEYFMGYDICIVAQRDEVGRAAAKKKLATLQSVSNYACIIEPPTKEKDFADYVVKEGGQGIHLLAAFRKAERASSSGILAEDKREIDLENPQDFFKKRKKSTSSLSGTGAPAHPKEFSSNPVKLVGVGHDPEMLNQLVHTTGIVAAKATRTFSIPWRFKVKVKGDAQRYYEIPFGRTLLSFIHSSDLSITIAVRNLLDNDKAVIETDAYITATEVEVIPTAAINEDVPYVTQRCYYIGTRIEANVPYELDIIPTTDSRSQETIGIIVRATPLARAVETATFSEKELAALQIFHPQAKEKVWDRLMSVAEELSKNQTKIFNRPDWHLVALLTWLSPIGWTFPDENEDQIQRGWLNSLAVGDTQTGKSQVVQAFQRLFRCGAVVNAENCTYVGLVGGAVKMGSGQFMLRWGRIPLADKQLVVIEELSGLSVEEISNMSDVRSSGIARLDKGGLSAETNARTRLLALSNVRPVNKNLAGYLSGVKAIQELIGHGEDIARFDLISTLVDREVSTEVINRPYPTRGVKSVIPNELWQRLCQFIWALKPNQIRITTDAYYACLEQTKRLAEIYHPAVPVFKGGSGRYKIARVAVAIACLQFSWNGKAVVVLEDHVDAAARFLELLYNKPSFGYQEWSRQMFDRDGVKDIKALDGKLIETIRNAGRRSKVMESLVHASKFNRDELCAIASLQIGQADNLIGTMVRERVLRKGDANVWEITPAGRDWMLTHITTDKEDSGTMGKHNWFNSK